eukprot:988028-Pyramimonas_sp.AAC.1
MGTSVTQSKGIQSLAYLQTFQADAASSHQRFNRHLATSHQDREIRGSRISHAEVEHCLSMDNVKAQDVMNNAILREIEEKKAAQEGQEDYLADEAAAAKLQADARKRRAEGKKSRASLSLDLEIDTYKTQLKAAETEFQASRLD